MHITRERANQKRLKKEGGIMRIWCLSAISVLLVSCKSLPNKTTPVELDITQRATVEGAEYVYCSTAGGAWGCKSPTTKTLIKPVTSSRHMAVSDAIASLKKKEESAPAETASPKAVINEAAIAEKDKVSEVRPSIAENKGKLGTVFFDFNSSVLKPEAKLVLLDLLEKTPGKHIVLNGYTDSIGEERYNQWLAEKRATVVKEFFEKAKVKATFVTAGFGRCCYVAEGESRKNRRVEILEGASPPK